MMRISFGGTVFEGLGVGAKHPRASATVSADAASRKYRKVLGMVRRHCTRKESARYVPDRLNTLELTREISMGDGRWRRTRVSVLDPGGLVPRLRRGGSSAFVGASLPSVRSWDRSGPVGLTRSGR